MRLVALGTMFGIGGVAVLLPEQPVASDVVLLKLAMQRYKIGNRAILTARWTPAACNEEQTLQTRLVALGR